jgi:hypothetical protein
MQSQRQEHQLKPLRFQDIYGQDLDDKNKQALMWISYLGCGLSLLGVLFTIITYLHFKYVSLFDYTTHSTLDTVISVSIDSHNVGFFFGRHLRRDKPSIILINLCFALLFLLISFILATVKVIKDNAIACQVIAHFPFNRTCLNILITFR